MFHALVNQRKSVRVKIEKIRGIGIIVIKFTFLIQNLTFTNFSTLHKKNEFVEFQVKCGLVIFFKLK